MCVLRGRKKGFTLVELLVTIGIIGILATATVVSIGSARAKARDARRVSDLKQIQTALTVYSNDKTTYPDSGVGAITLGTRAGAYSVLCDKDIDPGFQTSKTDCKTVYMDPVPADPLSKAESQYEFLYTSGANQQTYEIKFKLEAGVSGGLGKGDHTLTPAGIQ